MDMQTLSRGKLVQEADNQTWAFGENPIVFDVPYEDVNYVLIVRAEGCTVEEVDGTRTTTGVTVNVSQDTEIGYYRASGYSDIYQQTGQLSVTPSNGGRVVWGKKSLTAGHNEIVFDEPFTSATSYNLDPIYHGVFASGIVRTASGFTIESDDDNPEFEYIAIGT